MKPIDEGRYPLPSTLLRHDDDRAQVRTSEGCDSVVGPGVSA